MSNLLTGLEFNERFPTTIFVKLTNENENHNGYQFNTGLNTDTQNFDPTGECKKGGIYFCEDNKIGMWLHYNKTLCVNYRQVNIPDDAKVYIESNKFKTDKIILLEKQEIWTDEKRCKMAVTQDWRTLEYVEVQTDEICKIAIKQDFSATRYMRHHNRRLI
jgi:hypothetical protein